LEEGMGIRTLFDQRSSAAAKLAGRSRSERPYPALSAISLIYCFVYQQYIKGDLSESTLRSTFGLRKSSENAAGRQAGFAWQPGD
jgi:hypothetical protein